MPARLTTEQFIARAREVHGDQYDYSKAEYVDWTTKVAIICKEHGEFRRTPQRHLGFVGCGKCYLGETTEDYISLARQIHGERFLYTKTKYEPGDNRVTITCREHGEFTHGARRFITSGACHVCKQLEWEERR